MLAIRHVPGLLAAACLVLACGDEEERLCTLIGCGDVHETSLELTSDAPSAELTIDVCFNDECGSAAPAEGLERTRIEFLGGKLWANAHLSTDGERVLSVSWGTNGLITEKQGDRYAVRVKTADGTTVGESVEIAESYSRSYPNGKECDRVGCLHVDSVRRVP